MQCTGTLPELLSYKTYNFYWYSQHFSGHYSPHKYRNTGCSATPEGIWLQNFMGVLLTLTTVRTVVLYT
jgi:hypothetical protein